jgi:5-methylcytosine-specific restriction endonuclease McrBC GTP-binding regulatory subunit McrB
MFNIQGSDVNAEDDGELDKIDTASDDMEQLTYSRNRILFGPPGVGKSYSINTKLNLINVKEENITRITFHPEYSYYEFVGQYKPVVAYEKIVGEIRYPSSSMTTNEKAFVYYDFVPGPFTKAIINALKLGEVDNQKVPENALLIIEEINRGNSTAIFGDVFQLLDRINNVNGQYYGESEYSIDISTEMKEHIKKELDWEEEDWNRRFKRGFVIPSNLYIYSTMNTSDQSLYPMDSAFKRRWDMEYIYINYNEDKLSDLYLPEPYKDIKWLDFIKSINKEIVNYTGVDDKQIGQWFVGNSLSKSEFLGKIISYLWFDIFRYDPQIIFKEEIKTFDDIRSLYGKGIFNNEFINSIKIAEDNINDGGEGYERD